MALDPERSEINLRQLSEQRLSLLVTIDLLIETSRKGNAAFVVPVPVRLFAEVADVLRYDMIALSRLEAIEESDGNINRKPNRPTGPV